MIHKHLKSRKFATQPHMALIHTSSAAREHTSRNCYVGKVSASTDEEEPLRQLLFGGDDHRVVVFLSIRPNSDTGVKERDHMQFYYVISGSGRLQLGREEHRIGHQSVIAVNRGVQHVIYNTSKDKKHLRLLTVYDAGSMDSKKSGEKQPKKHTKGPEKKEKEEQAQRPIRQAKPKVSFREEPDSDEEQEIAQNKEKNESDEDER